MLKSIQQSGKFSKINPFAKSDYLCGIKKHSIMGDLFYILRYTVPALVVFMTAWFLLKEFFQQENKRRHADLMSDRMQISLPLRLQAYERLVLMLERMSPNNLIMRVYKPEWTAKELQKQLIKSVRDEYTHNLSQQLYVSPQVWELINQAYEETLGQINALTSSLDEGATATDLSQKILESDLERSATEKAMAYLKSEARKSF